MKNNPECYQYCPRILDAKERVAKLGRTGVVHAESVVKQPVDALVNECERVANSDCDGPTLLEKTADTSFLGRFGLVKTASGVQSICGETGEKRQEKGYLF